MGYRVLTVDDSATVRSIIAKTFRLAAVTVSEWFQAPDGQQALEILRKNWVDLVLTDLNMPVMSGFELIERMRQDGLLRSLPVIVVSSVISTDIMDELKAKGVRAYLCKPVRPEDLRKTVDEVMEASHARRP